MTNHEYHNTAMLTLSAKLANLGKQSIADRKEAQIDAAELMRDLERTALNLEWCLNGSYGYAEQVQMRRIQSMKRGNKEAQAMQLLAALDCFCPVNHAIQAWKSLTKAEQDALAFAIRSTFDLCDV